MGVLSLEAVAMFSLVKIGENMAFRARGILHCQKCRSPVVAYRRDIETRIWPSKTGLIGVVSFAQRFPTTMAEILLSLDLPLP